MITTQQQQHGKPATTTDVLDCPTCWVGPSGEGRQLGAGDEGYCTLREYGVRPATCPTCSVESVEWALALEIDALVTELLGVSRLEAAMDTLG